MSDDLSQMELVSCFMDGESGELPDGLSRDTAAKGCWRRYHLIRDVLRDSKPACLSGDFSTRVMQALENEPTVIAPLLKRRSPLSSHRLLKPVAGLAIAASVAAVAVMVFQALPLPGTVDQTRIAETTPASESGNLQLADTPAAPPAAISQETLVSTGRGIGAAERTDRRAADDESLNSYLLEHMEQSTGGHAPSMLPYVRLAGFESNR